MNNIVPILRCENLYKSYQEAEIHLAILKGINFAVLPGEMVAIVGTSGAGKTTFLQLLGGLDHPSSGEVFFLNQSLNHLSESKKGKLRNLHLGYVYQFHHLLPEFDTLENVCIPLLMQGHSPKTAKEKALYYLEKVNLVKRQTHRIGELSGGERQRVAIARALVNEPKCILADEPTGNLDQKTGEQVIDLLIALNESLKMSFVVVTHNLSFAKKMHRVMVLEDGMLQQGNM